MGYNYRESGYGRCDYLIVTKKGKEEGRLPDAVLACVGGGSNAIGAFYNFIEDKEVQLIGPADEAVAKINDMYRRVLYIKGENSQLLSRIREQMERYIEINKGFASMYIQYDFNA